MEKVLRDYKAGRISLEEAVEKLRGFLDLGYAKLDFEREARAGVPEIILAQGKSEKQLERIAKRLFSKKKHVIISRVEKNAAKRLSKLASSEYFEDAKVLVLGKNRAEKSGRVVIVSAGTSDLAAAEECRVVCEQLGCFVSTHYDVGVAGLHRLNEALRDICENADVVVVAAGMEGSLASVVAGMVDVLVIGLPTSRGYGYGGRGVAALMSMLQSCAPGLVAVNIDNGVGAALAAVLVAKKSSAKR